MTTRNVSTTVREDALSHDNRRGDWAMIPEIEDLLKDSTVDLISTMAVSLRC